jgi:ComF family protein
VLQAFKYEYQTFLSRSLVPLLTACVETHYGGVFFDAVAFVPLYPRRERSRTYNQAALLAAGVAAELGAPLLRRSLRRHRATFTQTHLSAAARRVNVREAFTCPCPDWIAGRRILLIDDVMTTGATVNECARVLKEAQAASVHVATVARG